MSNEQSAPTPHFVPSPLLAGKERSVARGEYAVLDGNDAPISLKAGQLTVLTEGPGLENVFPGVTNRGWYTGEDDEQHTVISFLYHKLDQKDELETDERVAVLTGIGYGERPGHSGQAATWYLIGPQIGTLDHETGQPVDFPIEDQTIPAKHFSMACIVGGPLGEPILANPITPVETEHASSPELQQKLSEFIDFLGSRLAHADVPELIPAVEFAKQNPALTLSLFNQYTAIVEHIARLTPAEMEQIQSSWQRLKEGNVSFDSASQLSAVDVVNDLDAGGREELGLEATKSVDLTSPYFEAAIEDFITRSEGGHHLKINGKTPVDGDPESDGVIWGHTQITNPETLLHFALSHYMERYMSQVLVAHGVEYARTKKDYFLNAMTDIIMLDHFGADELSEIYQIRVTSRAQGGLGWINQDRVNAFNPHQ